MNHLSKKLFVFILLLSAIYANAQIKFQKMSFEQALEYAKQVDKTIFIDAYTTWCGPCRWMSENVFTDFKVAKFYNDNFICIKVDMGASEVMKNLIMIYQVNKSRQFVNI